MRIQQSLTEAFDTMLTSLPSWLGEAEGRRLSVATRLEAQQQLYGCSSAAKLGISDLKQALMYDQEY